MNNSKKENNTITELERRQAFDFSRDYRLRSILSMIPSKGGTLLDIGSGNGEIANVLRGKWSHFTLVDVSAFLCENICKKYNGRNDVAVLQINGQSLPFADNSFDAVTMMDIIEHTADDRAAAKNAFQVLKPGGVLFISVPAFPFLYGIRDKELGHYRRYRKKELLEKLTEQGFLVRSVFYWNLLGVLPYFISEKILRKPLWGFARQPEYFVSRVINKIIYFWLLAESKIHLLPFGLTLVAIAEKPHEWKK